MPRLTILRGNDPDRLVAAFKAAFADNGISQKSDLSDPQIRRAMDEYRDLRNRMDALGGQLESLGVTAPSGEVAGRTGKVLDDGPTSSRSNDDNLTGTAGKIVMEMRNISPHGGKR